MMRGILKTFLLGTSLVGLGPVGLVALPGMAQQPGLIRSPQAPESEVDSEPLPEIEPPNPMRRPAIRELLRYDCSSDLATRSVVWFDDRVVRLKETFEGRQDIGAGTVPRSSTGAPAETQDKLTLHELTPDEHEAFLNRLRIDKAPEEGDLTVEGPGGAWVESCRLVLSLPEEAREVHRFQRYDSLSLSLSRRLAVAEDLRALVEEISRLSRLPRGYEARVGDVLERRDGAQFEIVRETGDRGGWELQGLEQPLTVLIPKGALRQEFVALVSRRER